MIPGIRQTPIRVLFLAVLVLSAAFAPALGSTVLAQSSGDDPAKEEEEGEEARFCPTPAAPAWITATSGEDRRISVSWASVTNPDPTGLFFLDYTVVVSGTGGSSRRTSSTSATFTGLTNGETYSISVRANMSDDIGSECSGPSANTTARPAGTLTAPPAPSGLRVSVSGTSSFFFSWSTLSGASKYEYEYSIAGGAYVGTTETTSSGVTISPPKGAIICGLTYRFKVRAYGNGSDYLATWGPSASTTYRCTPDPTVRFSSSSYSVNEGSTRTVTVRLSHAAGVSVTIPVTVTRGSAESGDYTVSGLTNGNLIFSSTATSRTFTIEAEEDTDCDDETVNLGFGALPSGVLLGSPSRSTLTIDDDEQPSDCTTKPEVSFSSSSYSVNEGSTRTVTVRLSPAAGVSVTIPVTVTRGSAESGDYTVSGLTNGNLIFSSTATSRTFTIEAEEDTDCDDETVNLGFGTLPSTVTRGSPSTSTLTIDDDEQPSDCTTKPEVSFSSSSYSVNEGSTRTVTVRLSPAAGVSVTIPVTVTRGSAESGDYTVSGLTNGNLIFSSTATSRTFTIEAEEDTDCDDETVNLGFGTLPSTVTRGSPSTSTLTIDDDEQPSDCTTKPEVSFSSSSYSVNEGSTRTVTVRLSPAAGVSVTIPVTVTRGSAESGDYTVSGLTNGNLIFSSTATSRTFTIEAEEDTDCDDETVNLGFGTLPSTVTRGSPSTSTLTIDDDEQPSDCTTKPEVSFSSSSYSVNEGSTRTVTVRLSPAAGVSVTIPVTVTRGSAESGDYTVSGLTNGNLIFSSTATSRTFTIEAEEDTDCNDETVNLGFGTLPSTVTRGSPSTSTLTIDDDEICPPSVRFVSSTYSVGEGSRRSITVRFSHAAGMSVTIPVTVTRGSAESGDYTVSGLTNGNLTFSSTATSRTFTIEANQDLDCNDETVHLGFGTLPSTVTVGSPSTSTLTIDDDEICPPSVRFVSSTYSVGEGSRRSITVRFSHAAGMSVTIPVTVTRGSAESGDYTVSGLTNGNLTFSSTATSRTFTIEANQDLDCNDETVHLGFGTLPSTVTVGSPSTSTLTIDDDEICPPEVRFSSSRFSVNEGSTRTVTVRLGHAAGQSVTIPVTVTRGSAESGDYTVSGLTNGNLTFSSTATSRTFTIEAEEDEDCDDETVHLGFGTLPSTVTVGSPSTLTLTINDDDEMCVTPPEEIRNLQVAPRDHQSLIVNWNPPSNDGGASIDRYDIQSVTSATIGWPITSTSQGSSSSTKHTIKNLAYGTEYKVRVRAHNSENMVGPWWPGDGDPDVTGIPVPAVSIAADKSSLTEGGAIVFTVTASTAPTSDLTVNISVTETGSFIKGVPDKTVPILANQLTGDPRTGSFTVFTDNDTLDEPSGTIYAAVQSGTGYVVGRPFLADVVVNDDTDVPPIPTGLRANGDLDSGNVTLRWNQVPGATAYHVRYAEVACTGDGVCAQTPPGIWSTATNLPTKDVTINGVVVKEAPLSGLTKKKLYLVQVQAVIADPSLFSRHTHVFPTDSALSGGEVATAPFHGYVGKNSVGSHEISYVICTETIPSGLTATVSDMSNAVDEWENSVTWFNDDGNIISTTNYSLAVGESCDFGIDPPLNDFEVKFLSTIDMKLAQCHSERNILEGAPACWRSFSWILPGIQRISGGEVLLNKGLGVAFWNQPLTSGGSCSALHEYLVHEVGHGFGIGKFPNHHPINTTLSIMSYANTGRYCAPQAYDIVQLMALYQSR